MRKQEIEVILIDLDGTLFDFKAAEERSLQKVFSKYQISLTQEIKTAYSIINHGLWEKYEKGEINREEVLNTRFQKLFSQFHIKIDGMLFEQEYQNLLAQSADLIDGAKEAASYLAEHYRLYAATNGVAFTQKNRLKLSGLDKYMRDVFVSETIGYQKPSIEFFDYCFDKIKPVEKEKIVMIGDSVTADMMGGKKAGIKTCWFHPQGEEKERLQVDFEIHTLKELKDIF